MPVINFQPVGTPKYSLRAHFLTSWFAGPHNKMVNVPVTMTTELLVFDFQSMVEKIQGSEKFSLNSISAAAGLLATVMNSTNDDDLIKIFANKGIKGDPEKIKELISVAKKAISDHVAKNTLAVAFVKNALESAVVDENFGTFKNLEFETLTDGVKSAQKLYKMIVQNTDTATLATEISNMQRSNSATRFIQRMYSVFNEADGPTSETRLATVLNSISTALYDEPMVDSKERVPGMIYDVTLSKNFAELDFRDVLSGFHVVLLSVMGSDVSDKMNVVTADELLKQVLLGYSTPNLLLPSDAAPKSLDAIKKAIVYHWVRIVTTKIATSASTPTHARMYSMLDEKKYLRADEYAKSIEQGIMTFSLLYDSFIECGHFFKQLATDRTLYQDDMHPILQDKYLKVVYEHMGSFATFTTSPDRPNHLKDPALVVNAKDTSGLFDQRMVPSLLVPDRVRTQNVYPIYDSAKKSLNIRYVNDVISGSYVDLPNQPEDLEVLHMAAPLKVDYSIAVPAPKLLQTDLFAVTYRVFEVSRLKKLAGPHFQEFQSKGQLHIVDTKFELASLLGIPLEMAAKMFGNRKEPVTFIDLRSVSEVYYVWNQDEAPIYDFQLVSDSRLVEPFVSYYPAFASTEMVVGIFTQVKPLNIDFDHEGQVKKKPVTQKRTESKIDNSDIDGVNSRGNTPSDDPSETDDQESPETQQ